jgi:hypothetical protein
MLEFLNDFRFPIHLLLHALIPILISLKSKFPLKVFLLLLGTMLVDIDHLLATPLLDPNRCSIGFHPLHSYSMLPLYGLMAIFPLIIHYFPTKIRSFFSKEVSLSYFSTFNRTTAILWIGIGLIVHMILDLFDCIWMRAI